MKVGRRLTFGDFSLIFFIRTFLSIFLFYYCTLLRFLELVMFSVFFTIFTTKVDCDAWSLVLQMDGRVLTYILVILLYYFRHMLPYPHRNS